MEKWQTKFVWQIAGCVVILLVLAGFALEEMWFFRAKFLGNPLRMLLPASGMVFASGACLFCAGLCVSVIISTRKHAAKMKALEASRRRNPVPHSLEPMSPEQKEEFRQKMTQMLQSASPDVRAKVSSTLEETMQETARALRAERGSTPEVEAAIAESEGLWRQVMDEVQASPAAPSASTDRSGEWSLTGELLRYSPQAALAVDGAKAWILAKADQPGAVGRVTAFWVELTRRVTAASPAERGLRLMPALNLLLTLFAFGLVRSAVERGRHTHEAVVMCVCVAGLWLSHLHDRRAVRHGREPILKLSWAWEWELGLGLTAVFIFLLQILLSPSPHHVPAPPAPFLHLLTRTIFGLFCLSLLWWWGHALRDLLRPAAPDMRWQRD